MCKSEMGKSLYMSPDDRQHFQIGQRSRILDEKEDSELGTILY